MRRCHLNQELKYILKRTIRRNTPERRNNKCKGSYLAISICSITTRKTKGQCHKNTMSKGALTWDQNVNSHDQSP